MAAHGARAAGRAGATGWCPHAVRCRRCGRTGPPDGLRARPAAGGLVRRPKPPHRLSLGRRQGRHHAQIRSRTGRACTRGHPGQYERGGICIAAGNSHHSDRVRGCCRCCRRWLCREPGAARRQRHWLYRLGICHEREMAGAAQRDRAARDAGGSASRFCHSSRARASSAQSRPWRHRWAWSCAQSIYGMPERSSVPSTRSRRVRMAA